MTGRDDLIADFSVLLGRVADGKTDKGMLVTGLRGVGKTVLLGRFRAAAEDEDAVVVSHEVTKGENFPVKFALLCRRALLEMSPAQRWKNRAQRAASVIKSFGVSVDETGQLNFGLDIDVLDGIADSGDLIADLPEVVVALGTAAKEHDQLIVFLFDEVQYLSSDELSALIVAKHQVNQRTLPVVLAGAGLPQLPALTATAQTYSERMFSFPEIGKLDRLAAEAALTQPAEDLGVEYEEDAIRHILTYTDGYPYFIQEYGKAVWDIAETTPITQADAVAAQTLVEEVLDQDFFAVRTDGLPAGELTYIKALASLGPGRHTQREVAHRMGKSSSADIGGAGGRLIDRGLVYRSRRGEVAFTVPHFDRYVQRAIGTSDLPKPRVRKR